MTLFTLASRRARSLGAAIMAGSAVLGAASALPARAWVLNPPPCSIFPADNVWNADVSGLPVDTRSAAWMASMGSGSRHLHPDFGPTGGQPSDVSPPYGIPFNVVDAGHPRVPVTFQYSSESDHAGYPLGADTHIEGGTNAPGDRHALVIDASSCTLFETYDTHPPGAGWTAGSGAIFDLRSNRLRPPTWTSADAAGLPIFPGLLRYDEVEALAIRHAIRFTANSTASAFTWPARHQAGSGSTSTVPPMGARFRLSAGFDASHYSAQARAVIRAMQHYGLILADNGSDWFFTGTADDRWDPAFVDELKSIPASQFQAVDESSLMVSPDSGQVRPGAAGPAPTVPSPRPPSPAASNALEATPSAPAAPADSPSPEVAPSPDNSLPAAQALVPPSPGAGGGGAGSAVPTGRSPGASPWPAVLAMLVLLGLITAGVSARHLRSLPRTPG